MSPLRERASPPPPNRNLPISRGPGLPPQSQLPISRRRERGPGGEGGVRAPDRQRIPYAQPTKRFSLPLRNLIPCFLCDFASLREPFERAGQAAPHPIAISPSPAGQAAPHPIAISPSPAGGRGGRGVRVETAHPTVNKYLTPNPPSNSRLRHSNLIPCFLCVFASLREPFWPSVTGAISYTTP